MVYQDNLLPGSVKEWRLVLHGLYSDVYIVDSLSLNVLYTLKSRLSPNWVSAVCTLRSTRKQEVGGVDIVCLTVCKGQFNF